MAVRLHVEPYPGGGAGAGREDEPLEKLSLEDLKTTKPMSPCAVVVIDGNCRVLGYMMYHLDSDTATPYIYSNKLQERYGLYKDWASEGVPLLSKRSHYVCTKSDIAPEKPCLDKACICNEIKVTQVPFGWVQERQRLIDDGQHWLQDTNLVEPSEFSTTPPLRWVGLEKIQDSGKKWKRLWESKAKTNPCFAKLKSLELWEPIIYERNVDGFYWNALPLTAYEVLVGKLDGLTLMNLRLSSPRIDQNIQLHFEKANKQWRELTYKKYCLRDLDRPKVMKIIASFDSCVVPREFNDRLHLASVTWEDIFSAYHTYWMKLIEGRLQVEGMEELEQALRDTEAIWLQGERAERKENRMAPVHIQRPLGGRAVFTVRFPTPSAKTVNLMVLEDFKKPLAKNSNFACRAARIPSFFQVKVAHFPVLKAWVSDTGIPEVERVMLSLCNSCMTTATMGGGLGATRKLSLAAIAPGTGTDEPMEPIFEVKDNVVAIWCGPNQLRMFLLGPSANVGIRGQPHQGYTLTYMYDLNFPKMVDVWDKFARFPLHYLPVITEYKGETAKMNDLSKKLVYGEQSQYMCHPTEPTYYGFSLVSPIYGVESFRPSESGNDTVVESFEPQVFLKNGRMYLKAMRQPKFSTKGHGMFVFCTDKVIAISWDCITWLFTDLIFPMRCSGSKCVKSAEVLHEQALMFVLNDCLVLTQVKVDSLQLPVKRENGSIVTQLEPELILKPMRVFQMDFDCRKMEISYAELNFDLGAPFLFVIADRKPLKIRIKKEKEEDEKEKKDTPDRESQSEDKFKEFSDSFERMFSRLDFKV